MVKSAFIDFFLSVIISNNKVNRMKIIDSGNVRLINK